VDIVDPGNLCHKACVCSNLWWHTLWEWSNMIVICMRRELVHKWKLFANIFCLYSETDIVYRLHIIVLFSYRFYNFSALSKLKSLWEIQEGMRYFVQIVSVFLFWQKQIWWFFLIVGNRWEDYITLVIWMIICFWVVQLVEEGYLCLPEPNLSTD